MNDRDIFWYRSDFAARLYSVLLLPLSWLYCAVVTIRSWLYRSKCIPVAPFASPVVVVGNITAGGTGKTPFIIELSRQLLDLGHRPGVVSRGYGGSVNVVHQVSDSDTAERVGDEPLMIHHRAGIPVVVGKDRVAAVDALLDNNDCDIVLSDDGLQHLKMYRDREIVIVDTTRGFGNARCIPAGPLREPVSRIKSVDIVVNHGQGGQGYNGNNSGQYEFNLVPSVACRLDGSAQLAFNDFIANREVMIHAVAGIGNPERFFTQLEQSGLIIKRHPFPDHHVYRQQDFAGWSDSVILMTEKDAVKCRQLDLPDAWYLSVDAVFSVTLCDYVRKELVALIHARHDNGRTQ